MASIVVAGGGLAGLACAWKLRRAGHEVEVLERGTAGPAADFRTDPGAVGLREADQDLLAAADALGIAQLVGPTDSEAMLRTGRFELLPVCTLTGLLQEPGGMRRRRLRWLRGPLASARRARGRPTNLSVQDGASLLAVLGRELGDDPLVGRLAAAAALDLGDGPEAISNAAGLAALARRSEGRRPVFLRQGLAGLRRALAAAVMLRSGCEVIHVETESDGARVRYRTQGRTRSVLADAVVVALPPGEVLPICPKLGPEERGFFERVETAPTLMVRLKLERPPLRLPWYRVGFPKTGALLSSLVAAHRQLGVAATGTGLLIATLAPEPSRRQTGAADAEICEAVLAALAESPVGRLEPLETGIERAASRPLFAAGAIERIARFERRMERTPRLAFAGGYLLGPGPGAAFTSGLRAATRVASGL